MGLRLVSKSVTLIFECPRTA